MFTVESELDHVLVRSLRTRHFPNGISEAHASKILRKARNLVVHAGMHPAYAVDVAARKINPRPRRPHLTYKVGNR